MVFVLQLDDDKFQEKLCRQTASPESQTAADATAAVTWREGFSLTWRQSSASKQRPTSLRCYLQAPAHHFYYSCMQPPEAFVVLRTVIAHNLVDAMINQDAIS
ncbi:hypothetical protein MUK42_13739 [Musa troglodytarum]|uniref:Uncharacterized protein n=1 Tax=Musa troglodytarum TaxID=320322 RepID=A0A9E7I2L6_9LILI|nr:hypothetical protein MUK42_13739 [Musa troglodytarum]